MQSTGVIEIPLTQGKMAVVDDEDGPLSSHRWFAMLVSGIWYAARNRPRPDTGLVLMHREIMGSPPGLIDHRDGDGLNNRRCNLRQATRSGNRTNSRPQLGGSSSFKGVHWSAPRGRWIAKLHDHGRNVYLGQFLDEEQAARAYDEGAREHFGEFARLNFSTSLPADEIRRPW